MHSDPNSLLSVFVTAFPEQDRNKQIKSKRFLIIAGEGSRM